MEQFKPEEYWPLGSTVQETKFNENPQTDLYRHFGLISANPLTGHMVMIYRRGNSHVGDDSGVIVIRHSSDGGMNWNNEYILIFEQYMDLRNVAGGYDGNGRLFVFYARYDPNASPQFQSMRYRYSDDDASSWSLDFELPLLSNSVFSPYGHIVDAGNDTLYQTWYGAVQSGSPTNYKIYLFKSTDGGSHFYGADIITVNDTPQPWGEPSLVNLGGGCFLLLARMNNEINHFRQFKSEDNCATWVNQGPTSFESLPQQGSVGNVAAPPFLSFINYEGVGVIACYYTNRTEQKLKVVFGLAKDLLDNGTSGWNENTKVEVFNYNITPPSTTMSGYQSFFLPLNQYKGIGVCFKEISNGVFKAYPVIVFSNITGMHNVLTTLGL